MWYWSKAHLPPGRESSPNDLPLSGSVMFGYKRPGRCCQRPTSKINFVLNQFYTCSKPNLNPSFGSPFSGKALVSCTDSSQSISWDFWHNHAVQQIDYFCHLAPTQGCWLYAPIASALGALLVTNDQRRNLRSSSACHKICRSTSCPGSPRSYGKVSQRFFISG